jgi:hypothetical protein
VLLTNQHESNIGINDDEVGEYRNETEFNVNRADSIYHSGICG